MKSWRSRFAQRRKAPSSREPFPLFVRGGIIGDRYSFSGKPEQPEKCLSASVSEVKKAMKNLPRPYDFFEHTADVGIQVYGRTLKELFAHGAIALFEFIADLGKVGKVVTKQVELECFDREELFVRWLSELLYIHEAERLLLCSFEPLFIRKGRLRATIQGEVLDGARHQVFNQVKAVTYHQVQITRGNGLWIARVILDV